MLTSMLSLTLVALSCNLCYFIDIRQYQYRYHVLPPTMVWLVSLCQEHCKSAKTMKKRMPSKQVSCRSWPLGRFCEYCPNVVVQLLPLLQGTNNLYSLITTHRSNQEGQLRAKMLVKGLLTQKYYFVFPAAIKITYPPRLDSLLFLSQVHNR